MVSARTTRQLFGLRRPPRRYYCSSVQNGMTELLQAKLVSGNTLTWYSCGPTVYDVAHLGHARTYVCCDIIRRILIEYYRLDVRYAIGMTDIDDKIIAKGIENGFSERNQFSTMTKKYETLFWSDMDALNVGRPDAVLRVTEHLSEIIRYIEHLITLEFAYFSVDGVYFDFLKWQAKSTNYDRFGALGSQADEDSAMSASSSSGGFSSDSRSSKRNPRDFALWKCFPSQPSSLPVWDSPWGPGRPGWHIECSAMTHSYFGASLDIHSGGVDLQFPHHTNEIAQCEAHNCSHQEASPGRWVEVWIHTGHLHITGRKMSKSLKNFISIQDYLSQGITDNPSDDFRIFCLQHKYSSNITYSEDRILEAAVFRRKILSLNSLILILRKKDSKLPSAVDLIESPHGNDTRKPSEKSIELERELRTLKEIVKNAFRDDFNTPLVLKHISDIAGKAILFINELISSEKPDESPSQHTHRAPIEPALAVHGYVTSILELLGLQFTSSAGHSRQSEGLADTEKLLDFLLEYRANVRGIALKMLKEKKQQKQSDSAVIDDRQAPLAIMKECDRTRKELLDSFGINVEDLADGSTKWSPK